MMEDGLQDFTLGASKEVKEGITKVDALDFQGSVPHFLTAISLLNRQNENLRKRILATAANKSVDSPKDERRHEAKKGQDEKARVDEIIESCIERNLCSINFKDLVNLEQPIQDMVSTITLPILHPSAFEFGVKPFNSFLLFGLPGTGKTRFAKAVAAYSNTHCKTTFFNASASRLVSKWQGESEKALLGLFDRAEKEEKSIIFFDEVDELLSHKKNADSDTSSRLKSLFLTCTDGIKEKMSNTILIAATNRPWSIEPSAWSRFQKKYYISLPDLESRKLIFLKEIGSLPSVVAEGDIEILAKKCTGYSGRNIKTVVVTAWMHNLQLSCKNMNDKSKLPPLTQDDLLYAVKDVKAGARLEDKTAMEEFIINEFGGLRTSGQGKSRPTIFSGP